MILKSGGSNATATSNIANNIPTTFLLKTLIAKKEGPIVTIKKLTNINQHIIRWVDQFQTVKKLNTWNNEETIIIFRLIVDSDILDKLEQKDDSESILTVLIELVYNKASFRHYEDQLKKIKSTNYLSFSEFNSAFYQKHNIQITELRKKAIRYLTEKSKTFSSLP